MNQKHIQGTIVRYGYEEYNGRNTFFLVLSNEQGQEMPAVRGKGLEEAFQKIPDLKQGDRVNLKDFGIDENTKKRMWEIERHEPYQDLKNEIEFDNSTDISTIVEINKKSLDKLYDNKQYLDSQDEKPSTSKKIDVEAEYLPDSIKHHYIGIKKNTLMGDEKINYYDKSDPDKISIAFEDRKNSLNTSRQDDKTVSAMLDLAESKGWTAIKLKGTEEFKQKAWLEATLRGIKTKGYEPSERDLAELQVKQEARTYNQVEATEVKVTPPAYTLAGQETIYGQLQRPIDNQAYLDKIGLDFDGVKMDRYAKDSQEVLQYSQSFVGQEIINTHSGIKGIISNSNIKKMISGSASEKSVNAEVHRVATVNADKLFENAIFAWQYQDRNNDNNFIAIHRAIAPLKFNDEIYFAKLTIKEMARERGNKVYSIEAVDIEQNKNPIPEMMSVDQGKQGFTEHRPNGALIDIVVENAQKYNMEKAKNQENLQNLALVEHEQSLPDLAKAHDESEPEKSVQDAQKDVMKLLTDNLRNDAIHSREDLIKIFAENGYTVAKENKKSVVFQLPNSEKTFKLTDEVLAKKMEKIQSEQAKTLLKMQEQLKPDAIKERYPNMNNVTIAQVTIYREYLENRYQEKPKALLEALTTLDNAVKDVASGKELVIPAIPANDVQPSVEIRTPERGDLSRNR